MKSRSKDGIQFGTNTWRILLLFLFAVVVGLLIIIYMTYSFQWNQFGMGEQGLETLKTGWYEEIDGERVVYDTLPNEVSTKGLGQEGWVIHRKLLGDMTERTTLCVETDHQTIEAYVGETKIYDSVEYNTTINGAAIGSIWNLIDIPVIYAGQVITLKYNTPYRELDMPIYDITLGSKSETILTLFKRSLGIMGFCFAMFLIGAVFILIAIIFSIKHLEFNRNSFLYLGLFILLSGLWILTDAKMLQFFSISLAEAYLLSFFSFMLMPVPFLLFVKESCIRLGKVFQILSVLMLVNFIVSWILYFCNVINMLQALPVTHLLILAAVVAMLVVCVIENRKYKNKYIMETTLGMLALCLSAVTALAYFYVGNRKDNSLFFRYGLLFFIVVQSIFTFRRCIEMIHSSMSAETYRKMAYVDMMTSLRNRTSFDKEMEQLQNQLDLYQMVGFAVFDLNNLKLVNDTLGHSVGDAMIKEAAACIDRVLGKIGRCFRIGGDEFVVIFSDITENSIEEALKTLDESISAYNKTCSFEISIARGYIAEESDPNNKEFVVELFKAADGRMYEQKKRMKA